MASSLEAILDIGTKRFRNSEFLCRSDASNKVFSSIRITVSAAMLDIRMERIYLS